MATTFASQTITVRIARDWREVYDFLSIPDNFPRWASGLGASLEQINGHWIATGPQGQVTVRFSAANHFGVLDHQVMLPSGSEVAVPMRVIANHTGSEVMLTLFRLPTMSDAAFAADADWVRRDLETLKTLLET